MCRPGTGTAHHPTLVDTEGLARPPPLLALPPKPFAASSPDVLSLCPGPFSRHPAVPCRGAQLAQVDCRREVGSSAPH